MDAQRVHLVLKMFSLMCAALLFAACSQIGSDAPAPPDSNGVGTRIYTGTMSFVYANAVKAAKLYYHGQITEHRQMHIIEVEPNSVGGDTWLAITLTDAGLEAVEVKIESEASYQTVGSASRFRSDMDMQGYFMTLERLMRDTPAVRPPIP
jgi:hypothetical protein